jgi:hypothetical protein
VYSWGCAPASGFCWLWFPKRDFCRLLQTELSQTQNQSSTSYLSKPFIEELVEEAAERMDRAPSNLHDTLFAVHLSVSVTAVCGLSEAVQRGDLGHPVPAAPKHWERTANSTSSTQVS